MNEIEIALKKIEKLEKTMCNYILLYPLIKNNNENNGLLNLGKYLFGKMLNRGKKTLSSIDKWYRATLYSKAEIGEEWAKMKIKNDIEDLCYLEILKDLQKKKEKVDFFVFLCETKERDLRYILSRDVSKKFSEYVETLLKKYIGKHYEDEKDKEEWGKVIKRFSGIYSIVFQDVVGYPYGIKIGKILEESEKQGIVLSLKKLKELNEELYGPDFDENYEKVEKIIHDLGYIKDNEEEYLNFIVECNSDRESFNKAAIKLIEIFKNDQIDVNRRKEELIEKLTKEYKKKINRDMEQIKKEKKITSFDIVFDIRGLKYVSLGAKRKILEDEFKKLLRENSAAS